ncbi:MFS transporter [Pilimelia columellifera]|uniref:MFS transporter n=1 Tax=Pilimelia columellifera subsp. columellifera TaxID=706583 RepID=A0ABP6AAD0_9ACTN
MTSTIAPSRPGATGVQRRTLLLLFATQIIGGTGVAIGISVGALLTARIVGTGLSGLAQSAAVVGGALLAIPATRIIQARGRRPGLVLVYTLGASGSVLVVIAATTGNVPLLFVGLLLFGGGTTANLQARYAAVDLAAAPRRGRQLSLIVWATTIGSVAAPHLAPYADGAVAGHGLAALTGPFVVSALAFLLAGALLFAFLRPDPLLTARMLADQPASPSQRGSLRLAARTILAHPEAKLAVTAVAVGHLVMVGVMAMTPVHLGEHHHSEAELLRIVGIVISAHIAGMYALSPVVGWLTDRAGRRPVIAGGALTLAAGCAFAATAGHDTTWLTVGLVLLGLGWSGTMVAGSTLLTESVPIAQRAAAQGLSDLVMGLAGASAGAVSGFVVAGPGYDVLAAAAGSATLPLAALALVAARTDRSAPVPADKECACG